VVALEEAGEEGDVDVVDGGAIDVGGEAGRPELGDDADRGGVSAVDDGLVDGLLEEAVAVAIRLADWLMAQLETRTRGL
jgi:hypothetical protein